MRQLHSSSQLDFRIVMEQWPLCVSHSFPLKKKKKIFLVILTLFYHYTLDFWFLDFQIKTDPISSYISELKWTLFESDIVTFMYYPEILNFDLFLGLNRVTIPLGNKWVSLIYGMEYLVTRRADFVSNYCYFQFFFHLVSSLRHNIIKLSWSLCVDRCM